MTLSSTHFNKLSPEHALRGMIHATLHWREDLPKAIIKDLAKLTDSMDVPTSKHEDWKGYNIDGFLKGDIFPATGKPKFSDFEIRLPFEHHTVIVGNGDVLFHDLPQEVTLTTVTDFYRSDFNNIYSLLNLAITHKLHGLDIGSETTIELPIVIYKISKALDREISSSRLSISLGENSKATFLMINATSKDQASMTNDLLELRLEANAECNFNLFDNRATQAYAYSEESFTLHDSSKLNVTLLHRGAEKARNQLSAKLLGENAEFTLHAALLLTEGRHQDLQIKIEHLASNTRSRQTVKNILNKESVGYVNGRIIIPKNVAQIDAYQSIKNLLLDSKSKAFSRPQLEIASSDVKCSHGCTTGRLSLDELFYLEARGISKSKARKLLLHAFVKDIFSSINHEAMKSEFIARIGDL